MRITLGISGSISSYRSAELVKKLKAEGHEVRCVLTRGGSQFVTEKVLETFSGNRVLSPDIFDTSHFSTDHIELARWADLFLIYGASANFLGRLASGIADDFLNLQLLAFSGPVILVPAMNPSMWSNALVSENCKKLERLGYRFVNPIPGIVACGEEGVGHVASDEAIFSALALKTRRDPLKNLTGKRVLISAGPMHTSIDPVRRIQNRSSGKMGLALAKACKDYGASEVTLLLGPVSNEIVEAFGAFSVHRYESPKDYGEGLDALFPQCDIFFSAAAVLDFEVIPGAKKIERSQLEAKASLEIAIRPVPDFAARMGAQKSPTQKVIAFAAETGTENEIITRATEKMIKKSSDAIIANPVSTHFGPDSDQNLVWVLRKNQPALKLGPKPKSELGHSIIECLFS
jgi:phosphopantothenoylcysteine decarboxylase/phosphopantothenate--cysteine ligase